MLIAFVIAVISFSYVFYNLGFSEGMRKAGEILDQKIEEKFRGAGVVVKSDDRIIECFGFITESCFNCRFGRVQDDGITCFAPDYDEIPVIGLRR